MKQTVKPKKFDYVVVDMEGSPHSSHRTMSGAKEALEKWNKNHKDKRGRIVVVERV